MKKTNKKWGIIGVIVIILWIVGLSINNDNSVTKQEKEKPFNMDSLIATIKKDQLFEVKDVYYNKKDSSLNIAITNKDGVIKRHEYSAKYFNNTFLLDKVAKIEGVYIFEYIKGKAFAKNDYKSQLDGYGQRTARLKEKFDKKLYNAVSGVYKPIRDYLKENLNDPSSLEIDKTWNLGMNKDSSFAIKTTFRCKNQYNALVLQALYCNLDFDGNITNVKIE